MHDEPQWIATPHIRPDHRGPVERPWWPFADPAVAPPILETLQAVATCQPDRVAVEDAAGGIRYRQLLDAAGQLAHRIEQAQPSAAPVAILLPSSPAYAVALFACLLAQRPAVLLDEYYPAARNAGIAALTGVTLVLAAPGTVPGWPGVHALAVDVSGGDAVSAKGATHAVDAAVPRTPSPDLDRPAFLLCTSGSSGAPKAIVHSQRTMLHWARTTHEALHVGPDDRVLSLSSLASLGGFTGLLNFCLAGATVQMLELKASGLAGLLATLQSRPVTILRAVPSTVRGLARLPGARRAFAGLRVVQTYGEPLMKADLDALLDVLPAGCKLRSTYGSTEASGLSWFAGAPDDHDPLRVASGTLMPDTVAAIVDDDGRSCTPGEAGELWIRSRYNALGEWRGGQLVAGALEPHPSSDGTRVFRTGDIARCDADGVFVVLGRADRMVKINGQRLEPAEIETALRRIGAVQQAEVVVRGGAATAQLVAFVVASDAAAPGLVARLRGELKAALPSFMMPSRIVLVPSIPMLPGGKVDRLALLTLAGQATGR